MYGVSQGPGLGWAHAQILGSIVAGTAVLVLLVRVELRSDAPLLRLRLLGNRLFRSTSAAMAVGTAAFLGALFVIPLFFQSPGGRFGADPGHRDRIEREQSRQLDHPAAERWITRFRPRYLDRRPVPLLVPCRRRAS